MTRRDLIVAAIAACATMAGVALADSIAQSAPMKSSVFAWEAPKAEPTPYGGKRSFFDERTATLDRLECHVTTVNPGLASHAPHRHAEEEVIIVKEGTVEAIQNEATNRVGPGGIIFHASNDLHALRNVGETPATYYVIQWTAPGLGKTS